MMTTGTCVFCRRIGGQQLEAVHAGQLQIGEHQVGAIHQLQAFFGGAGLVHFETGGG